MAGLNTTRDGRNPGSAGNIKPGSGQSVPQRNLTPTYPSQANMGNKYAGLERTNRASSYAPSQNNTYSTTQDPQTKGRTFNVGQDRHGNVVGAGSPTKQGQYQIPTAKLSQYSRGVMDVINDPTKGQDVAPVLSSNIAHFLDPSNPINQQLSQQALGQANRRGLANSSMAISASQQAILERASQLGMDATTMGNENWARNLGFSKSAVDDQFKKDVTTAELSMEQRRLALEAEEQNNRNRLADSNIKLQEGEYASLMAKIRLDRDMYLLDNSRFLEEVKNNRITNAQRDTELANLRAEWESQHDLTAEDIAQKEAEWRDKHRIQDEQWNKEFKRKYNLMARELALKTAEIEAKYPKNADGSYTNVQLVESMRKGIANGWNNFRGSFSSIMSNPDINDTDRKAALISSLSVLKGEIDMQRAISGMAPLDINNFFPGYQNIGNDQGVAASLGSLAEWLIEGNPIGVTPGDDDEEDDDE